MAAIAEIDLAGAVGVAFVGFAVVVTDPGPVNVAVANGSCQGHYSASFKLA